MRGPLSGSWSQSEHFNRLLQRSSSPFYTHGGGVDREGYLYLLFVLLQKGSSLDSVSLLPSSLKQEVPVYSLTKGPLSSFQSVLRLLSVTLTHHTRYQIFLLHPTADLTDRLNQEYLHFGQSSQCNLCGSTDPDVVFRDTRLV